MEHGRGSHASADVSWTGCQVTKASVIGEIEFRFEGTVNFIDELEGTLQLQTGTYRLHPQMVFFVDHDAQGLPPIHDNGTSHTLRRMFTANEMPLDQYLFL